MRHRVVKKKLNRDAEHRKALLINLLESLFYYNRVKTTVTKAKWMRPFAEKLITLAKSDNHHNVSQVKRVLRNDEVIRKLFKEISPSMIGRNGGYTRIKKTGEIRKGDASESAIIEILSVSNSVVPIAEGISDKESK